MKKIKSIKLSYRYPMMTINYITNNGKLYKKSKIIDNSGLVHIIGLLKNNCYDDIVNYMK